MLMVAIHRHTTASQHRLSGLARAARSLYTAPDMRLQFGQHAVDFLSLTWRALGLPYTYLPPDDTLYSLLPRFAACSNFWEVQPFTAARLRYESTAWRTYH